MQLWEKLKDLFAAMSGGEKMSDSWTSDVHLRAAVKNFDDKNMGNLEGGLFLVDLKEFLGGLDEYNEGLNPRYQFKLVVHKDAAGDFVSSLTRAKTSILGYSAIGNLGLERNGRVYRGEYFNDQVFNTGFVFKTESSQGRYLCGLPQQADFTKFATDLLHVPVHFPAPAWVR